MKDLLLGQEGEGKKKNDLPKIMLDFQNKWEFKLGKH